MAWVVSSQYLTAERAYRPLLADTLLVVYVAHEVHMGTDLPRQLANHTLPHVDLIWTASKRGIETTTSIFGQCCLSVDLCGRVALFLRRRVLCQFDWVRDDIFHTE